MASIEKSVLVAHSAEKMYALVDRVEDYPQFLPWCGGTELHERTEQLTHATIKIDYHGVKQHFSTQNKKQFPSQMDIQLVDGPFKAFHGYWKFIALDDNACKIIFQLQYEFASPLLAKLIAPVFSYITDTFVDRFVAYADQSLKASS